MASSEVGGDTGSSGGVEASDSSVMGDINVTPLVDVMLVLLIIFMIVTPAIMAGFQAQMPEGAHLKARPEEEDRTTFGVDREGNWYLNKKPIRKEDAQKLLEQEFLKHPDDKVLFVKADRNLKYGELLTVMETAKKAGVAVFAAVTDSKPGSEEQLEMVREGE
jgi:biopolymer transport protein TolR